MKVEILMLDLLRNDPEAHAAVNRVIAQAQEAKGDDAKKRVFAEFLDTVAELAAKRGVDVAPPLQDFATSVERLAVFVREGVDRKLAALAGDKVSAAESAPRRAPVVATMSEYLERAAAGEAPSSRRRAARRK